MKKGCPIVKWTAFFMPCTPLEAKSKSMGAKLKGSGQSYIVSKTAFIQMMAGVVRISTGQRCGGCCPMLSWEK